MKEHSCLICVALAGITILHSTAFVQTARPGSTGVTAGTFAPLKINGQDPKEKIVRDCEAEWRASREAMMKRGVARDSYVEQCSVRDDVPAVPTEPKTAPPAAPK